MITYPPGFLRAWSAYPHWKQRSSKRQSSAVWQRDKLEPHTDAILAHIWLVEGGMYSPGFQVWLKKVDYDEPAPAVEDWQPPPLPESMQALVTRTRYWQARGMTGQMARLKAKREIMVGGVYVPAKYAALKGGEG